MNRYYTTKIEQLERQQKAKIEKLETSQGREQRDMVSQLKKEQQRELDAFNQNMKQEQSELKKQVAAQFNDRKSRQTTLKNRNVGFNQFRLYVYHSTLIMLVIHPPMLKENTIRPASKIQRERIQVIILNYYYINYNIDVDQSKRTN